MKTRKAAKIDPVAHRLLKGLSKRSGRKINFLLDEAIFEYLARMEKVIREAPEPK